MSPKRKEDRNPKKLTAFFQSPHPMKGNNHEGNSPHMKAQSASYTDLPDAEPGDEDILQLPPSPLQSPPPSPSTQSPAKSKMKLDTYSQIPPSEEGVQSQPPQSIASFPTTGQPVLDSTLKDMLLSLQSSLTTSFTSVLTKFSTELKHVDDRVHYIENKMEECTVTVNDLVDAYNEQRDDTMWIRSKLADLEDRSRRNNLKIRGIPETIPPAELRTYATKLFSIIAPELSPIELTIDRIHRIPKPRHLDDSIPRDVLMRVHFFQTKEQILSTSRSMPHLPEPFTGLQLYPDLSQHTLQLRRQLKTVTKALNNHKLIYKWRHPATLVVTRNGTHHTISNIQDGMKLLHSWGIIPELPQDDRPKMDHSHFPQNNKKNKETTHRHLKESPHVQKTTTHFDRASGPPPVRP